jgi:Leucine-rich repeat (LRR) protein
MKLSLLLLLSLLISSSCYGQNIGYFTDLESTIGKEDSVIILDLTGQKIAKELYRFPNLEKIFIIDCEVDSISKKIFDLKKIQTINIRDSKLKFIHSKVFDLPHLKNLLLSGNELKGIDFKKNLTIENIDISYNKINEIEGIEKLKELKSLKCRGNKLKIIPCEILLLENLMYIDFRKI